MADNTKTIVEKNIAFKIAQQFPALYREEGQDLVKLVEEYYRFLEKTPTQGVYNVRRMFEYRDIGNTLASMIVFFQKKFLSDLPLLDDGVVRFVVKNILDLYRRKGTESGILLFFRMFYEEDVELKYPAQYMFKPSDSDWKSGTYLQLFPNTGNFYSNDGQTLYTYLDLISMDIIGSVSKAKAIVDKINFIMLNNTLTPIIYITEPKGKFSKYDDIIARFNGEDISFGILNGSASGLIIDLEYGGTTGNKVGDIYDILSSRGGQGGKAIVTEVEDEFTGTIDYQVADGGFGYTIPNTRLLVSNQSIVLKNENFQFVKLETLRDSAGNEGIVIGQNAVSVGVRMNPGESFDISRPISTIDRVTNFTLTNIFSVAPKNDSSPGPLLPENGDANTDVQVAELSNIENIALITDVIGDYVGVALNSSNYNDPPAAQPMSGSANPVTINTVLEDAFDLVPFDIGTIVYFKNVNPGSDYINDVFSLAIDDVMKRFERFNQILLLDNFSGAFSIGDEITQTSTGVTGLILEVNNSEEYLVVRPYSYYGFKTGPSDSIVHKGNSYDLLAVERDYNSKKFGENAIIKSTTQFSTGRISKAEIRNSGFGYIDGEEVFLVNEAGEIQAKATLIAQSQGITSGFWGKLTSHLNGYIKTKAADGEDNYFDGNIRIQDSDYYQEYSYVIRSVIDDNKYRSVLRENVHLAGTKQFSEFVYKNKSNLTVTSKMYINTKEDNIIGGAPIVGPNQEAGEQEVRADNAIWTVDTTAFTADIT